MTDKNSSGSVFQTLLLVVLVIFSAIQVSFIFGLTPNFSKTTTETSLDNSSGLERTVRDALLQHEYEKVGGKENYEVIVALQRAILTNPASGQDIETQKQLLAQLQGSTGTTNTTTTATTNSATLTEDQRKVVLEDAVVEGNKDADIVVVEYSEMECPFCAQQYHDTKLHPTLEAEYSDKVAFVYKNNRGVDHAGTEVKSLGLLCAKKVGGADAYAKFYKYVMDNTTYRPQDKNGSVFPVAQLAEAAKAAGITDVAAWQSCVDNKETLEQFAKETREAASFGLSGTPGTLIFNQKTGAYTTISGAYPYENFKAAVDALLK